MPEIIYPLSRTVLSAVQAGSLCENCRRALGNNTKVMEEPEQRGLPEGTALSSHGPAAHRVLFYRGPGWASKSCRRVLTTEPTPAPQPFALCHPVCPFWPLAKHFDTWFVQAAALAALLEHLNPSPCKTCTKPINQNPSVLPGRNDFP